MGLDRKTIDALRTLVEASPEARRGFERTAAAAAELLEVFDALPDDVKAIARDASTVIAEAERIVADAYHRERP